MDWWIVFFDNLWRDPAMSTAIQLTTLLILIWTLYWIREYTMVARQQYQGSYRPMVVLEITQSGPSVQGLNITGVSFHNVGIGPALAVRMSDWQNGPYK